MKWKNVVLLFVILMSISCSWQNGTSEQKGGTGDPEKINLPDNIKSLGTVPNNERNPIILSVAENNDFSINNEKIAKDSLKSEIEKRLQSKKDPNEKTIFIKADRNISYEKIIEIVKLISSNSEMNFGLVGRPLNNEVTNDKERLSYISVYNFSVAKLTELSKPNPLTLVIQIKKDGSIAINKDNINIDALTQKLTEIFRYRESNGVFREGTNEVEKTVYIKAPLSAKYSDVINLIDAVNMTGANPIGLQLNDLEP